VTGTIPDIGVYLVTYDLPFGGPTGVRLEVMEDPAIPLDDPGYHADNGNFVLTELVVTADIQAVLPALGMWGLLGTALGIAATGCRALMEARRPRS
jgi:hypothetical protein